MPEPDRGSVVPLYHQLRLWLEEQIRAGTYQPGALLPSERELCERFRLSNITVRKALSELVHAGLIYRQNGVGSFVAPPSRHYRLALVVVGYDETWWRRRGVQFSALIGGIARVTCDTGAQFTMAYLTAPQDLADFIRTAAQERSFDGLLIRPRDAVPAADLALLSERNLPYVVVRARPLDRAANCVRLADEEEAYLATKHLLGLGHERIAYVGGGQDSGILEDRFRGYRRALAEAGVPFDATLTREGDLLQRGDPASREVVAELLHRERRPTALLVATSPLVPWVYYAIRDQGLRIPEDISVVGADEDVAGPAMAPALTRFGRSHYDLGTRAAALLIDLIAGSAREPTEIVLPPTFQVGGSTAPAPAVFAPLPSSAGLDGG